MKPATSEIGLTIEGSIGSYPSDNGAFRGEIEASLETLSVIAPSGYNSPDSDAAGQSLPRKLLGAGATTLSPLHLDGRVIQKEFRK